MCVYTYIYIFVLGQRKSVNTKVQTVKIRCGKVRLYPLLVYEQTVFVILTW